MRVAKRNLNRACLLICSGLTTVAWSEAGLASESLAGQERPAARVQDNQGGVGRGGSNDVAIGEIVVTARKRAESFLNVPVAVSSIGEEDVQRFAAADLAKISEMAPQVKLARGSTGTGAAMIIRGLGSGMNDQALEQTVSINIDGFQVNRGRIIALAMFDVKGVEILRGPQALFFGKNSPAGVVSINSKTPGTEADGYVTMGYEFVAREAYFEGATSVTLSPTLRARFAVRGRKMDGWLRNTAVAGPNPAVPEYPLAGAFRSREPRTKEIAGRATVVYEPTEDTSFTLRVLGGKTDEGGIISNGQSICFAPSTTVTVAGYPDPGGDCRVNRETQLGGLPVGFPTDNWPGMRSDGKPYQTVKTLLSTLLFEQKFGDLSLTSVTGYMDLKHDGFGNSCFCSTGLLQTSIGEHTRSFSQELRLTSDFDSPVNFTLGGFYGHNKMDGYLALALFYGPGFVTPDPVTGKRFAAERRTRSKGDTLSAFGQLRWQALENLELAGGVRYTREKKSAATGNVFVRSNLVAAFAPAGVFLGNDRTESNWSPEVTATWHPAENHTIYAAYKTGYKSGGISQPFIVAANFNQDNLLFGAERIKGGEIGYKALLAGRRLQFDLTVYNYKVKNLQTVALITSDTGVSSSFLTNAGAARTRGVEASLTWRLSRELTLRAAGGYNSAKYLRFTNSPCYPYQTAEEGCLNRSQDLSGRPLPRAPKLNVVIGGSYEKELSGNLVGGMDLSLIHSSGYYLQETQHPLAWQKDYQLLNGRIWIGQDPKGWELSIIGRNLTNKHYSIALSDISGGGINQFGDFSTRPREVILQAKYNF